MAAPRGASSSAGGAAGGSAHAFGRHAAPAAVTSSSATDAAHFPFLGTPMAVLILDFIPQQHLGPVRLVCKDLLDASRALTFLSHPYSGSTLLGDEEDRVGQLVSVGRSGSGPTLPQYCTLFPSALKVGVVSAEVTEEDAALLRRFSDITMVRVTPLRESVMTAMATRGPEHPPLRKLRLDRCDGPTGAAFASMPHLQELGLADVGSLKAADISLPVALTCFRLIECEGRPWSMAVVADLHNLRHLKMPMSVAVPQGVDLGAACPLLETMHLLLKMPSAPSPELVSGFLPKITWAGLSRLRDLDLSLMVPHGVAVPGTVKLDPWLADLHLCAQLQQFKLATEKSTSLSLSSLSPLPPTLTSLDVDVEGPEPLNTTEFKRFGGLRKLHWRSNQGMDQACDLAEACPLLEDVKLGGRWSQRSELIAFRGLPKVTWARLTRLRGLDICFVLYTRSLNVRPYGSVGTGWLAGLPPSLERLKVYASVGPGPLTGLPLLTDGDIADLPALRVLVMSYAAGFTGSRSSSLPALEYLRLINVPACFTSFKFVSGCTRLVTVSMLGSFHLQPAALADLPACVQRLEVVTCKHISVAQAQAACPGAQVTD